ncbi:MAG: cytochrome C biosynthesis protein, partial [Ignavibacteria bacterium]|nr:cytochrome C biosynthesis protein [Ignavibacteria bacterium]
MDHRFLKILLVTVTLLLFTRCSWKTDNWEIQEEKLPEIEPDYSGVVIPPNIAPLNFIIKEEGSRFLVTFYVEGKKPVYVRSVKNLIRINPKKWKRLLEGSFSKTMTIDITGENREGVRKKYAAITSFIAADPVDPYLTYRVIYPGYERWNEISVCQRDLQTFRVRTLINNYAAEENCINCHSFNNGKSDDFLFHMRGSLGGTFFYSEGRLVKYNLKTPEMKNGAVYPRWHPSGRYVAFSSNKIVQRFHVLDSKRIEVNDLESSLVLYDRDKNEIMPVALEMDSLSMDTYPEWSPDGKFLYFCRAPQIGETYDYKSVRYDLWRVAFNTETRAFGKEEIFFSASDMGKSISFPRISPDGKYIIVTISSYGCFP